MSLNLEPIRTFLSEDTNPKAFAKLLDDFLYDYNNACQNTVIEFRR